MNYSQKIKELECPAPLVPEGSLPYFSGHFSSMMLGNIGEKTVSVKVWRGASMSLESRIEFTKRLCHELTIWRKLSNHPNIAHFLGLTAGFGYLPCLVLPYFEQSNASDYVSRNPNADTLRILSGVADALHYMHSQNPPIAHGKIKGSNILIYENGEACLTDLGMRNLPYPQNLAMANRSSCVDEVRWMAPELIDPGPSVTGGDDGYCVIPASDVYSFGMTALELISRQVPFAHRRNIMGVIMEVTSGIRPPRPGPEFKEMTDEVWNLLTKCWVHKPMDRLEIGTVSAWVRLLWETTRAEKFIKLNTTNQ
ncbi:kinase-like protein [Phlegmacium glaucopus]|nr:kinase-like protein [Phlegmacium glaucopus]